ncbi:T6SS immunity protein Tli4 family protein [Cupriavidus basilensis]
MWISSPRCSRPCPIYARSCARKAASRFCAKASAQIAGMEAEEVLFSIREGGSQLYRFHLLAPGNPDSVAQPHTEIQLRLGSALTEADKDRGVKPEAVSSLVDEAGAIQAWDALLDSMRLRPGAM